MLPHILAPLSRRLRLPALAGLALVLTSAGRSAESGMDAAEAIGPFLNGVFPSQAPGPAGGWTVERIYPNVSVSLPTFACPYPGTNKFLVVEKDGRIRMFENTPNVSSSDIFLDIRDRTYSNSDSGMTYLVFHPEFGQAGSPNRGYVYITYKWSFFGDSGSQAYLRLSRFTVPDGQLAADPNSELILIQQYDRQQWHDAGCMLFGPDGYLYVGLGDEGGANDQYDNTQKIDDRLWSGILRIDVDQDLTRSHPIRRQPRPAPGQPAESVEWPRSFTQHYTIPNDNPFLDPAGGVLEEFYAIGFRNPYRFAYDPASGEIWVADVGQDTREEVDRLVKGGNYGWAFREGTVAGPKAPPSTIIGTLTEPLWDYSRSLGGSIIGSFFYYGNEHPSLRGKYLVVDNVSGRIWALTRSGPATASAEHLTNMPSGSVFSGTTTTMEMPDGEVYFVKLGSGTNGEIYKLARTGEAIADPPALLSQTGAFSDLATLTTAPGLIPYTVNAPLWSDAAAKRRWIAIPNDGTPDSPAEKIQFAPNANWKFPTGTVFVKHFELPDDETNPASIRRLETRFLVMSATGEPYGVTYRWRPDGSDADLLTAGQEEVVSVALAGGGTRQQTWSYPSRANCMVCHNATASHVLGVQTHQLNSDLVYPQTGRTANQLSNLASLGFFDDVYRAEHLPFFLRARDLPDIAAPLETRVRSYIDSNCAHCHRPGGVRSHFDARFTTPLRDQGLVWGEVESQFTGEPESVIRPGDVPHSILYRRDALVGPGQMPPLAKNLVDQEWLGVLEKWIDTLGTGPGAALSLERFDEDGDVLVRVVFTSPVTDLSATDFRLRGTASASLSGSGAEYTLRLAPSGRGSVRVDLPAGVAFAAGLPNHASNTLVLDPQDPTLAAWLKLDETAGSTAADSSIGGNDGTVSGIAPNDWIDGKFRGALRFDAEDARVTMPNLLGGDFTISFWMRPSGAFPVTDNPVTGAPLFWADAPGGSNDFLVAGTRSEAGLNRVSFLTGQSGSSNSILHGSVAVDTGDWVHVAVRRIQSSGLMEIFVDGVPAGERTGSTALLVANALIEIGSSMNGFASYVGALDQIRLFTSALSPARIAELASETAAGRSPLDRWLEERLPGLTHLHDIDLDPNGDGVSIGGDFVFGGDPLQRGRERLALAMFPGGSTRLAFPVRADAPDIGYSVRYSFDLIHWHPAGPRAGNEQTTPGDDPAYLIKTIDFTPAPGDDTDRMFFDIEATGIGTY